MSSSRYPRTADPAEQAHFAALSGNWWDMDGPMAALHAYNPVRLAFTVQAAEEGLGQTLDGLSILDVGCGAGILSEALAKAGAKVTGLDATPEVIKAATAHAKVSGLKIDYICGELTELAAAKKYDIVMASEVVEHVTDVGEFLTQVAAHVRPGGLLIISTMNRTPRSLLLGVIVAEQFGLAPKGTHHWQKFVKPSEIAQALEPMGFVVKGISGARYNPLTGRMKLDRRDTSINYLLWAQKSAKPKKAGRETAKAATRVPAGRKPHSRRRK